jgi:hypothetical protein
MMCIMVGIFFFISFNMIEFFFKLNSLNFTTDICEIELWEIVLVFFLFFEFIEIEWEI